MAKIENIERRVVDDYPVYTKEFYDMGGHAGCPCKSCRFPYGELVYRGKELGIGPDSPDAFAIVKEETLRVLVDEDKKRLQDIEEGVVDVMVVDELSRPHGDDSGLLKRQGYGSCNHMTKESRLIVSATVRLDNGLVVQNGLALPVDADDAAVLAAVNEWVAGIKSDTLVGATL